MNPLASALPFTLSPSANTSTWRRRSVGSSRASDSATRSLSSALASLALSAVAPPLSNSTAVAVTSPVTTRGPRIAPPVEQDTIAASGNRFRSGGRYVPFESEVLSPKTRTSCGAADRPPASRAVHPFALEYCSCSIRIVIKWGAHTGGMRLCNLRSASEVPATRENTVASETTKVSSFARFTPPLAPALT